MNYGLKAIHLTLFGLLTVPLTTLSAQPIEWIRPSASGDSFVHGERAEPFRALEFNYDLDKPGRLLEYYWQSEWDTVVADFSEMKALKALAVYDGSNPLVIEEMFPFKCGLPELDQFVTKSAKTTDGWIGFYRSRTLGEYRIDKSSLKSALMLQWLDYFQTNAPARRPRPRKQ